MVHELTRGLVLRIPRPSPTWPAATSVGSSGSMRLHGRGEQARARSKSAGANHVASRGGSRGRHATLGWVGKARESLEPGLHAVARRGGRDSWHRIAAAFGHQCHAGAGATELCIFRSVLADGDRCRETPARVQNPGGEVARSVLLSEEARLPDCDRSQAWQT